MRKLTIETCENVTEYLNKLRRYRSDLAGVGYELTEGLFVTAILDGLDSKKSGLFKEKWDTIRVIQLDANPEASPNVDLLEERLHHEALIKQRREDEKKKQDKAKTKPTEGTTSHFSSITNKRDDRSHLQCNACGKNGHTEDGCWKLHPEKIPCALKDRASPNNKDKSESSYKSTDDTISGNMAAFVAADVAGFKTKLATKNP